MVANGKSPKTLRQWRGKMRQWQAARILGVSVGYYCKLENRYQHPHRKLAKTISDVTGLPLEKVLGF